MTKKGVLILVLAAVAAGWAFPQTQYEADVPEIENSMVLINNSIDFGFIPKSTNFNTLMLSPFSYEEYKAAMAKDRKWGAFVLNFAFGMGIGSFYQGDTKGGIIGLCGEASGILVLCTTFFIRDNFAAAVSSMIVGLSLYFGTKIFEFVRPFIYANGFSVALIPNIDTNGKPTVTAMAKFKF